MGFPGEHIEYDPNEAVQARNAALMQEITGEPAQEMPGMPVGGWPEGLGPGLQDVRLAMEGLPGYLTNPSQYVPSPEERDPNQPFHLATQPTSPTSIEEALQLSAAAQATPSPPAPSEAQDLAPASGESPVAPEIPPESTPSLHLAEKHHKLKCPKCDTVQAASNDTCTKCGHNLTEARKAKFANLSPHMAILYQQGAGLNLGVESGDDGLVWKIACKTGTLALSPGPGQIDVEQPLHLTGEMFREMKESFEEKAFPYVTVPETHANGPLENTGYVKAVEVLTKEQALTDPRVSEKAREVIQGDPDDTEYLLNGIEFTEPEVRQKALNGSIPDTSIGVKFNYRNKRTGKTYKTAFEHLNLTPIPWIDGLPAFGLSQRMGTSVVDADDLLVDFDGVYVDMPKMDLAVTARVTSGGEYDWDLKNIDPAQIRADATTALAYSSNIDLPCGVGIQKYGKYFVVKGGYDKIAGIEDTAVDAINTAMAALRERYEAERTEANRYDEVRPRRETLPPWPEDEDQAEYSAQPQPPKRKRRRHSRSLNLAVSFDPKAHPRDYKGQFREIVGKLKPGEAAKLPDGTEVKATAARDADGEDKTHYVVGMKGFDGEGAVEKAADEALRTSTSAGKAGELPESLAESRPSALVSDSQKEYWDKGTHVFHPDSPMMKRVAGMSEDDLAKNTWMQPLANAVKIERALRAGDTKMGKGLESLQSYLEHQPRYKGSDKKLSARTGDTLSLGAASGTLDAHTSDDAPAGVRSSEPVTKDIEDHMPRTVEELLAEGQAEREAQAARIAELESQLALSQATATSAADTVHATRVKERAVALQSAGLPPALCLAARQIWLADAPHKRPTEGGLNLSVATPPAEGQTEPGTREFKSASDIVDFLLSAVPTEKGVIVAQMATLHDNLDELNASQKAPENTEEAKRRSVDEWEREAHPERFNEDGTRKTAAAA